MKPLPSGSHWKLETDSFSNLVAASASPPSGEISQTLVLPPRLERKAMRWPSGDHAGALSRLGPRVNWKLRPVANSTSHRSEFITFSSKSATVATNTIRAPSGDTSTFPKDR